MNAELQTLKDKIELQLGRALDWHDSRYGGGSAYADVDGKTISVIVEPGEGQEQIGGDIDLMPVEIENPYQAAAEWMEMTDHGIIWKRDDPMPRAMYGAVCQRTGEVAYGIRWAIGDLLNYGEFTYGETYHQYSDLFGFALETLKQYKRVTKAIPFEERDNSIKWSYWQRIAALDADNRAILVDRIKDDDFEDVHELGDEVKAIRNEPDVELLPDCPKCGGKLTKRHCKGCGLDFAQAIWWLHDLKKEGVIE